MSYKYDVFISYRRSSLWPEWVSSKFLPLFEHWLGEELADSRGVSIFFDQNLEIGQNWSYELNHALSCSRVLVPLWSRQYFMSLWCKSELAHMIVRQQKCGVNNLILPAVIHNGASFPEFVKQIQWCDLTQYVNVHMAKGSVTEERLSRAIRSFTSSVGQAIQQVPIYDPNWQNLDINGLLESFPEWLYNSSLEEDTLLLERGLTISDITVELKRYFARHPEKLYDLNPRKFEQLVADILKDFGFDTELTQATRDGGVDIYAYMRNAVSSFLIFVECKRYSPENKVGVEIVREVHGTAEVYGANKSMIVTTSFFTKPAVDMSKLISTKMDLKDYNELKKWLSSYKKL